MDTWYRVTAVRGDCMKEGEGISQRTYMHDGQRIGDGD